MATEGVSPKEAQRIPSFPRTALRLLILALLLLPLVGGQYAQYLAIQVMILSLFALGFNILFG